jgi:hypothetical protein
MIDHVYARFDRRNHRRRGLPEVADTFADSGQTRGLFFSAGTYRIELATPGDRDWIRDSVVIGRDQCHVKGITLTARLQPVP